MDHRRDAFWTSLTELHKPSLDDPRILKTGDPQMAILTLPDSASRSDIDYTGKPLRIYRRVQLEPADEGTLAFPLCETIELPTKHEEMAVVKSMRFKVEGNPEDIFASRSGTRGCFTKSTAQTYIECQFRCRKVRMCRVAYFNATDKSCWFSMYVDSLLPAKVKAQTGTWQRTEMDGVY
ncbi:hypothetical protein PHET_04183 [Paragonimus heterotremus]|uniref:Apple domain-containing protein n=1 Tax=Paragonimus heterotremus TaxID=100268 RepID=A0A8J4TCI9_9TREM|nr:hypothetical protein PHET_04183 [Paragonimus heterotremus]